MTSFSGGCVCGAVRYQCTARPIAMFNCHCRTCQRVSGGAYVPVVLVRAKTFKITQGVLRYHFTEKVGGGQHRRGFCGECGSRLTGAQSDENSPWIGLAAGSLDDPSWFQPQYDIFASHAEVWDRMDPQLPKHAEHVPLSPKK